MENVNHPSHYNQNGRGECIDEMVDLIGIKGTCFFCLGNAYKYMYRAGTKEGNSFEQDMQKAKWYIQWASKHASYIGQNDHFFWTSLDSLEYMYERKMKHDSK